MRRMTLLGCVCLLVFGACKKVEPEDESPATAAPTKPAGAEGEGKSGLVKPETPEIGQEVETELPDGLKRTETFNGHKLPKNFALPPPSKGDVKVRISTQRDDPTTGIRHQAELEVDGVSFEEIVAEYESVLKKKVPTAVLERSVFDQSEPRRAILAVMAPDMSRSASAQIRTQPPSTALRVVLTYVEYPKAAEEQEEQAAAPPK